nr:2-C-methyl-D-erythritol 2,4-cyclodiphosphate synthase [Mariprofundus ferrooxydans]
MKLNIRVGQGYDVHPFADGRKLILGGVEIPHERGLAGHSDADVLCHALCDALLGAAGLHDIGAHFPDTDEQYKGADSTRFVSLCVGLLAQLGWSVGNVDVTVIAQEPKVAPFVPLMRQRLAELLLVDEDEVNVKATTTERLGSIGRREGIAAQAVVLIARDPGHQTTG